MNFPSLPSVLAIAPDTLLPWAGLFAALVFVYLVARWVTWLGMSVALRHWKRAREKHWSERARLAWPGRRVGALSFFIIIPPLLFTIGLHADTVALLGSLFAGFLVSLVGYVGTLQTRIRWERRLSPAMKLTPRAGLGAWVFRTSLIGVLALAGFVLVGLVSSTGDGAAWAIIACGTLAATAYLTWGWTRLLRLTGVVRPASSRLQAIVAQLIEHNNVGPVRVEQAAIPVANAFAFVVDRSIAVTDATLAILTDDELSTVCAHELAHLNEPKWVWAVRLLPNLLIGSWVAIPAALVVVNRQSSGQDNSSGPGLMFWASWAYLACVVVFIVLYQRMYRRMEIRADAMGKAREQRPTTYACALEKIYAANLIPVVIKSRRHRYPELYDRVVQAGAQPDYLRPPVPPRGPLWLGLFVVVLGMLAGCVALPVLSFLVTTQ